MNEHAIPLLEFDPERVGIIEPSDHFKPLGLSDRCVMVFYKDVIEDLEKRDELRTVYTVRGLTVDVPVYEYEFEGNKLLMICPPGGASVSAAFLEIMIALGCGSFVACGSAGVLHSELGRGTVIVVASAVRDEGTSYHYLPAEREISISTGTVEALEGVMKRRGVDFRTGKTWTTDAIYRETRDRIRRRREEGCLTVEMEASALIAVAQYRGVRFGQLLAAGDDVSGDVWDPRREGRKLSVHERLFRLAAEGCLGL